MPAKQRAQRTFTTGDYTRRKATDKALTAFQEAFAKEMGSTAVRRPQVTYTPIPTGSLALDAALKIGGWPKGRIVEVWGPEHAGKTSLALLTAAEAQKDDPDRAVAFVDMEQTFDSTWAQTLGVDLNRLILFTPEDAEDTADAVKRFVGSGLFSLVILDSIGGMISRVEYEKEADEATVGLVAKTVTRMVKQAAPMASRNETTVMAIHQGRSQTGGGGPDEDTAGGWALKHVTSVRVQVRRGESVRARVLGEEITIGHQSVCRIQKNKVASSGGAARFVLISQPTDTYESGVDQVAEVYDVAKKYGALGKGAWVTLPDGQKFQGRDKTIAYLRDNPDTVQQVRQAVLDVLKANPSMVDEEAQEEDDVHEAISAELSKGKKP